MNKIKVSLVAAGVSLALAFTLSCSNADSPDLPPLGNSNDSGSASMFCVYPETQRCFSTTMTSCTMGGELMDFCPFPGQGESSGGGSSSSAVAEYIGYCDYGPPHTGNEIPGCYPITSLSDCDTDSHGGKVVTECGKRADMMCDYGNANQYGAGGCYRNEGGCSGGSIVNRCPNATYPYVTTCTDCPPITLNPSSNSSITLPSSSSVSQPVLYGTLDYQGQTYKTVKIGTQTWMAENLNYNASGSMCYNNQASNCTTYGRLYNWATAMDLNSDCNYNVCASQVQPKHSGICPQGWHIPSNADWYVLMTAVGGSSTAVKHLKAKTGWNSCGPSGSGSSYLCEDTYGFSALPGGGCNGTSFYGAGYNGGWWSSTERDNTSTSYRYLNYNDQYADWNSDDKALLFSVRCLQD